MAHPLEHVEYLSKELGARPAGTEEEQNAALYIADQIQKETNFHAEIEEFTSSSNFPFVQAICCAVIVVVTILAMAVPVLAVPAFVLAAVSAAIYTLEAFDRPIVTRAVARSASQNVVAKYQPNADASTPKKKGQRTRKIVLVAHYDSGKVTPSIVEKAESTGWPLGLICVGGTIAAAFFLLIRIFVGNAAGVGSIILNVLSIVAILIVLLPIVKAVLVQTAPYNEGANNNAAGVAAMMEVARRISRGSVSEADLDDAIEGVAIHGEAAAIANGLVPEGAEIRYEAERLTPPEMEPLDDEERLLSAKAAIAALTGKPVEKRVYGSVADHLVNTRSEGSAHLEAPIDGEDVATAPIDQAEAAVEEAEVSAEPVMTEAEAAAQAVVDSFDNAPSWFVAAQQKAKRSSSDTGSIQRSRYTEAIEAAEKEAAERERIRQEEERARQEEERQAREQAALEKIIAATATTPEPAEEQIPNDEDEAEPVAEPIIDGGIEFQPVVYEQEPARPDETIAAAPINMADLAAELAAEDDLEIQVDATRPIEAVVETQPERRRVVSLPSVVDEPARSANNASPSRSGMFRRLRADVPSLSGVIRMQEAGQDVSQKPVERASQRPAIQAIPDPAEEVAAQVAPEPVNDAEPEVDYDMELNFDEPAENEYVDERTDRRDNRYDDQYDDQYGDDDFEDEFYQEEKPRKRRFFWQGGAFSRVRLGHVDTRSGEDSSADEPDEMIELEEDVAVADEIEKIYHFRNPLYTSEVWFVAIGSDTDAHDGALAFVEEHKDELRGAMVIEIESLGLGALSVASEEGRFRKVSASSRIKRYMRSAQAATGITPGSVSLAGSDSIASIVQKAGFQAMHLFGAENGKPALKGSVDDVLENLDEDVLDDNVNFLMELLKHN